MPFSEMSFMKTAIYTIGHSTHPIDEFIKILQAHQVESVVDVRTVPRSRHNPQFNQAELELELHRHAIGYTHLKELGGLRHPAKTSINNGWKNSSVRGFADYMQTGPFQSGIDQLVELAQNKQTIIMCAEALPWRCHRSLIADALLVRGFTVEDIMNERIIKPHKMTPWASIVGNTVTYPGISPTSRDAELVNDLLESHSVGK
jgi:uncharacterized protein (DUF488 family)